MLLLFVSNDVNTDYKNMLSVTEKYSDDAKFVSDLVNDFSVTSESPFASITDVLQMFEVFEKPVNTKESTDKLKIEIEKFKIGDTTKL